LPLFNRSISLTVGQEGEQGIVITNDLRIAFDVHKTETSEPNQANITIYNLSSDTRNRLNQNSQVIILKAGYLDGAGEEIVFKGDVNYFNPDVGQSEFECSDGSKKVKNKTSASYKSGANAKQVLQKFINDIGLPLKQSIERFVNKTFNTGFTFNGIVKDCMDKITNYIGLNW
jgi:CRISPR/Cas system-associated protein Csx1